ncbi:hypothetical protein WUBG_13362 [Wuchereria bancrofti]|uniref:Uncharacterized protein n=1 Tax=Wuchereria bancrofti TaxID=6293 RepID=J9E0I6_WUCBA|nr:hypothetical protein WUBG_13362 [Wuchereria bancrofti]
MMPTGIRKEGDSGWMTFVNLLLSSSSCGRWWRSDDQKEKAGEVRRGASLILLRRSLLLYALTSIVRWSFTAGTTTRPHFKEGIILIPKAHFGVVFSMATSRHMGEAYCCCVDMESKVASESELACFFRP